MKHIIKNDERKIKRDINKVLSDDIKKYLSEILTNSDDSYQRLIDAGKLKHDSIREINVILHRSKREIEVIDFAEGMSLEALSNFANYGANKSGSEDSKTVRGMFGQGATDVFLNAAINNLTSKIISIKDNKATLAVFSIENRKDRVVEVKDITEQIQIYREKYDIKNNGTIANFGLPPKVMIQRQDALSKSLNNYYMLRSLLSKSYLIVNLIDKDTNQSIRLEYDLDSFLKLEQIEKSKFTFKYNKFLIHGEIDFRYNINKNPEDGILIFENNNALDNAFFDRKTNSGMQFLEGRIELQGAIDVIRYELDQILPQEIITDTRDGFNKQHEFYKLLKEKIEPKLIQALETVAGNDKDDMSSLKSEKDFNRIFNEINKHISEQIEEISPSGDSETGMPPIDGLRFDRVKIKITKGKKYRIGLSINTEIVKIGSFISLKYNSDKILVSDELIEVKKDEMNPQKFYITIEGKDLTSESVLVKATYKEPYSAELLVDVIDTEIHYPKYGLEFFPGVLNKLPVVKSKSFLYVDTSKFNVGTSISIKTDNSEIAIDNTFYLISNKDLIFGTTIAMIQVGISGGLDNYDYNVEASIGKSSTELLVKVRVKIENEDLKSGFLNDIKAGSALEFVETYYMSNLGHVIINNKNMANITFLSKWFETNKPNKQEKLYLAALVSTEMAKFSLKKKIEKGKIDKLDNEEYFDELQKEKEKLFIIFFRNIR
jgi:hypothetical protein